MTKEGTLASFKKSMLLVATILIASGSFFVAGEAKAAPTVIINEFVSNPSTGNEWVELLNATESPIDLTSWILTDIVTPGHRDSMRL